MKKILLSILTFIIVFSLRADELEDILKIAFQTGNYKEIVKHCAEPVELRTNLEEGSYSKTQAEIVLRNFFNSFPATSFNFIHKGKSPNGARYSIGSYTHKKGTFRVYIKITNENNPKLDTIDFTEE